MMNETITLSEPELPQLRQMVLENTRRISRNEQMIDQMRKKEIEEERKRREKEEFWENIERERALAQQKHDRDICEMREILKEADKLIKETNKLNKENAELLSENARQMAETDRRLQETDKQIKETNRQMAETDRRLQETDKQIKETDKQIKETSRQMAETDRRLQETDRRNDEIKRLLEEAAEERRETEKIIREMSIQFMGRTGHIVEGLLSSSAEKVFQEAGLDLHNHGKNLRRKLKAENKQMEVDVLLSNDEIAVPIEVKTNCTKGDVHKFLRQMKLFRNLFPEYSDKKVIAAIAAINYENGVDTLAHKEGLLVIRVNSDDIFSLDPFDKGELKQF